MSVCFLPVLNWNHLVGVELEACKISPNNIEVANVPAELLDLALDCIISINLTLAPGHEVNHNGRCRYWKTCLAKVPWKLPASLWIIMLGCPFSSPSSLSISTLTIISWGVSPPFSSSSFTLGNTFYSERVIKLNLEWAVERFFAVPPLTDSPGLLHHLGRISEDARNVDCCTLTCELQAPSRGLYYFRKSSFL